MNFAVILAAGNGTRMGQIGSPKQFLLVEDKPILFYTISAFEKNCQIDSIIITTSSEYIDEVKSYKIRYGFNKIRAVILGGSTRQESTYNAIQYIDEIKESDNDIVLIHDAARPLVSDEIINTNLRWLKIFDAVSTAIPCSDTLYQSEDDNEILKILDRKEIYQAQTPQSFKLGLIRSAHNLAHNDNKNCNTDDCGVAINAGYKVHIVKGNKLNFKITTPDDLELFKAIIKTLNNGI